MKKSIFGKIGAAAVVLTLVTSSLVGGTFAKYATTVNGKATAAVAKWAVDFKDGNTSIKDDTTAVVLKNMNTKAATTDNEKLAPGSNGTISLTVDGTGTEVGYTYKVKANVSSFNVPIVFYSDENMTDDNKLKVEDGAITLASATVDKDNVGTVQTINVYWKWPDDEANSVNDTKLGNGETAVVGNIPLTLTAEQLITTTP